MELNDHCFEGFGEEGIVAIPGIWSAIQMQEIRDISFPLAKLM